MHQIPALLPERFATVAGEALAFLAVGTAMVAAGWTCVCGFSLPAWW